MTTYDGTEIGYFELLKEEVLYKVTYTTLLQELKDIQIIMADPDEIGEISIMDDVICNMYLPYSDKTIVYINDLNEIITNLKLKLCN